MPITDYAAPKPLYSLMLEEIENTSKDTSSGTMVRQAAHIDILMWVLHGAPLPHFGFRGSLYFAKFSPLPPICFQTYREN